MNAKYVQAGQLPARFRIPSQYHAAGHATARKTAAHHSIDYGATWTMVIETELTP